MLPHVRTATQQYELCSHKQTDILARTKRVALFVAGYNIWRGYGQTYDDDGRGLEVVTSSVDCWAASDKCMEKTEDAERGVLHR